MIAAVSGAVLLLSLFLAWAGSSVDVPEGIPGVDAGSTSLSGWESQNTLDIYLFIVAAFALVSALMTMSGEGEVPLVNSAATFLLGAIGTIMTLYVLIDIPEGAERKFGLILATIAVAGVTVGAYLQMQDEAGAGY